MVYKTCYKTHKIPSDPWEKVMEKLQGVCFIWNNECLIQILDETLKFKFNYNNSQVRMASWRQYFINPEVILN